MRVPFHLAASALLAAMVAACAGLHAPPAKAPTTCGQIVTAIEQYGTPVEGAPMFVECSGKVKEAGRDFLAIDEMEKRCAATGCVVWRVLFDKDEDVKLRWVRRFSPDLPFPPRLIEMLPVWGWKDGRPFIASVQETGRS